MRSALRREDLSFVDRAPVVIVAETVVEATPERIWPALAEASAWRQWFAGMRSAHYTSETPHGVGSTRSVNVGGFKADEEVIAFDVDRRFAFVLREANVALFNAMVEEVTLEAVGTRTRVVYRQAVEPKPWLRPFLPILRAQLQRGLRRGLADLGPYVLGHSQGMS
ncbi:MAG: SRPBCC family protein [Actinobacteria bacterium]|nr:SRPBCC family protein [Actinomycetota bacterium]